MFCIKVEASQTALVQKIISLHDASPLEWDPTHRPQPGYFAEALRKAQADGHQNGAMTLTCETHTNNKRMQSILHSHKFQPQMISFSLDLD